MGVQAAELGRYKCRHGTFFANPKDMYIGRSLIEYGEFSELEVRYLCRLVPSSGHVVEAGANIGALTVPLAKAVGPKGRIYAFEPQPVIFETLRANCELNSLAQVDVINAACGARVDTITFPEIDYETEGNFGAIALANLPASEEGKPVQVLRLDDLKLEQLDLLKADVEGMECEVIAGSVETIGRLRPLIYLENDRPHRRSELIAAIRGLDYRLWWHMPPLFNPDNWAGRSDNLWPGIVSVNMICIPTERCEELMGSSQGNLRSG